MIHCKKCQSTNLFLRNNGPHVELRCYYCMTFQKFVEKRLIDWYRIILKIDFIKEKQNNDSTTL